MGLPLPANVAKRYQGAIILQVLAPLSWGFGLWLISLNLHITGNACLNCFSQLSLGIETSASAVTQIGIGSIFFLVGFLFFVSSLGIFASKDGTQAVRWLRWMGRWRPRWTYPPQAFITFRKYRWLSFTTLAAQLVGAILVIPGIGEDRTFVLNNFYDLWGTVWYLYTFTIGIFGLVLIYKRIMGGYALSVILSLIAVGAVVPDLLGLLPPASLTSRTSIIFISQLPFSILCIYASWREFRVEIR